MKFQERSTEVPEGETPTSMNLIVYDDLVDECKPGDEIQVIGIYRAEAMRVQRNRTKLNSVFRSYIDVISVVYDKKNKVVIDNETMEEKDKNLFTEEEIRGFY